MRDAYVWVDIFFGKLSVSVIDEYLAVTGYDIFGELPYRVL